MELNDGQRAAVEAAGADILVSASAGSGKTAVMIERVLRLIERGARIDRMLIVTFTKAAAAGMKERLFSKLCEKSKNKNCAEALKKLPQADISTLHSFCVKLARTYFYAIEIDPAFELLGDDDGALLNKCLDVIAERETDKERSDLYEIMLARRKDTAFKKAVKKLYLTAVGTEEPTKWLDECLKFYEDDTAAKEVVERKSEAERKKLAEAARDCAVRTEQAKFERNIAAIISVAEAVEKNDETLICASPRGRLDPCFAELNEEYKFLRASAADFFERSRALRNLCPSAKAKWCAKALRDAARELAEYYENEKKKNGVADYNDLEHYAYAVLNSDVGERIRESYDYIFVDEYQDINPLQEAIIQRIKGKDNLFMVGDLKQSIYAFRGCDPSIFRSKRETFKSDGTGKNIELNFNYRTEPVVIDGINKVFDAVMTSDFGGVDYKSEARLVAARKDGGFFDFVNVVTEKNASERELPEVYRLSKHDFDPDVDADEAESDFVAEEIQKLLLSGKAQPSDIAVLTRSKSALSYMIRDKLKAANTPAFVKETVGSGEKRETAPIVNFMRLIDNAADDVALTATLKSYCSRIGDKTKFEAFPLSSKELAEIALMRTDDEAFWQTAMRAPQLQPFFERLRYYTALAQSASAGEIAAMIAEETDAFNEVRKMSGGDCRSLSELLRSAGDMSVREFLERTDSVGEEESAAPYGALKIMTVHMSKGLEFPYVFLAGVGKEFNKADFRTPYVIDGKWGLAFKYPDEETKKFLPTFLTEAAAIEGMNRALEEELRIAYVALTRAMKGLVVSGSNLREASFKRMLKPPARMADFLYALTPRVVRASAKKIAETVREKAPVAPASDESGVAKEIIKRIEFLKERGERAQKKAKTSVTAAARKQWEEDGYEYGGGDFEGESDAAERGTAYHLFMQLYDFEKSAQSQKEELFRRCPEEAKKVDFEKIERAAELVGRVTGGYTLYREKEFVIDVGGTLMQGVVDLLAVKDGEAIVVDYKTGKNVDNEKYKTQLDLYADAVERLTALSVKAKYICALDLGIIKEIV